jgi:hypothetical protein
MAVGPGLDGEESSTRLAWRGVEAVNSMAMPWWTSGRGQSAGSGACSTVSSVEDDQKTCDTFDPNPMIDVRHLRRTEKLGAC